MYTLSDGTEPRRSMVRALAVQSAIDVENECLQ
jgi:hypothetical protein